MAPFDGTVEYQKREYCRDVHCPIQLLLDAETAGSERYEFIRGICKTDCLHTTHEFHAWLNAHEYRIARPA